MELRATATDEQGVTWSSHATFAVPASGAISTEDPSLGGSWTGVQPMGLFTDMTHTGTPSDYVFFSGDKSYTVHLSARQGDRVVATASTRRVAPADDGVTRKTFSVAKDGVYGWYFAPAHPRPDAPAVLLFGGSEGGLAEAFGAETLAADGYSTLTIAYFNAPGLPKALNRIPIEYFERAGRLLQRLRGVTSGHIAIWGISRGSEAAILTAAAAPNIFDAVIAGVPADRTTGATDNTHDAAWTINGKPLPVQPYGQDDPNPADSPATFLPADRVRGPILTICGGLDQVWNSCNHAEGLQEARTSSPYRNSDVHLTYPESGHAVGNAWRYLSFTTLTGPGNPTAIGGTLQQNILDMAAARTQVLQFLSRLTRSREAG